MPWAVTRKQHDNTKLYLQGESDVDVTGANWTPNKSNALVISTEEKAELIVRLLQSFGSADYEVVGITPQERN